MILLDHLNLLASTPPVATFLDVWLRYCDAKDRHGYDSPQAGNYRETLLRYQRASLESLGLA